MSTATQAGAALPTDRLAAGVPSIAHSAEETMTDVRSRARRPTVALTPAFVHAGARYLLTINPGAQTQIAHWEQRARLIPSGWLRRVASESLAKRGNIEGAALPAILAPSATRATAVRALVAFQAAYNYVDTLSERVSVDSPAAAEQLHQALLVALHPHARHADYYRGFGHGEDDGGYLHALVDACRDALADLPSFGRLSGNAREAAARIVDFQILNRCELAGGHRALAGWAAEITLSASGLRWWETAAAAGSSLELHALIAIAANPEVTPRVARVVSDTYYPWVGALHTLLDSLVDREEDRAQGQRSLLDHYGSRQEMLAGIARLGALARQAADRAPDPLVHRSILTAMCSYYLSAPQVASEDGCAVRASLTSLLGRSLPLAIGLFRAKRLAHVGPEYS